MSDVSSFADLKPNIDDKQAFVNFVSGAQPEATTLILKEAQGTAGQRG